MTLPDGGHILVAFGANVASGGRSLAETIRAAVIALGQEGLSLRKMSRLYSTPCFPPGAGPDYVNAAAEFGVKTDLRPDEILARLHAVEARFGRERLQRWGQRTLDIDLIAMGDAVLPDAATQDRWRGLAPEDQARLAPVQLILPHPRLQDRAFVLVPLADVAPLWRHPRLGLTVIEMLGRLPVADLQSVVPIERE